MADWYESLRSSVLGEFQSPQPETEVPESDHWEVRQDGLCAVHQDDEDVIFICWGAHAATEDHEWQPFYASQAASLDPPAQQQQREDTAGRLEEWMDMAVAEFRKNGRHAREAHVHPSTFAALRAAAPAAEMAKRPPGSLYPQLSIGRVPIVEDEHCPPDKIFFVP